jgi:tRNA pseudouridine55 synthase
VDLDGIVLIDKDEGITSFNTVQKVKQCLRVNKAGHAGTLDKAASGLLIVCLNRATSAQNLFMSAFKRYQAKILFGEETDTLDRYGKLVKTSQVRYYSDEEIRSAVKKFLGKTLQEPPHFSAIHKNGKRLYKRALEGEKLKVESREIEIKDIKILSRDEKSLEFEVLSSKGTYIRALGRDIAHELGTCGYITKLRRLTSGKLSVENAVKLKDLNDASAVIPLNEALKDLPQIRVTRDLVALIHSGVSLERIFPEPELTRLKQGYNRVTCENNLIAIIEKGEYPSYFKVFN